MMQELVAATDVYQWHGYGNSGVFLDYIVTKASLCCHWQTCVTQCITLQPCCTQMLTVSVINWWPTTVNSLSPWPSIYVDSTWDDQHDISCGWCLPKFK